MKTYVGVHIVKAEYYEKDGQPGYTVVYPDGYVSWSPAKTFENAYRDVGPQEWSPGYVLGRAMHEIEKAIYEDQQMQKVFGITE